MELIKFEEVEAKIITIRQLQVIIDSDIAVLYGVDTRDINKSVKNNPNKFPQGYLFELTIDEKRELVENFHRFKKLKHSTAVPKCFTEKGLYMLATILKSTRASATTLSIIETFSRFRELGRNIKKLQTIKTEEQKQPVMQRSGEIITEIFENDLSLTGTEISFEINFAVLKFKHTIKKGKSKFLKRLKQKVEGNIKWSLKIIRAFRNMKPLLNLNLSNTLNLQNSTKFGEYNH